MFNIKIPVLGLVDSFTVAFSVCWAIEAFEDARAWNGTGASAFFELEIRKRVRNEAAILIIQNLENKPNMRFNDIELKNVQVNLIFFILNL